MISRPSADNLKPLHLEHFPIIRGHIRQRQRSFRILSG